MWKKGTRVRFRGLQARAELNGCIGVLLGGVLAESGRAPVKLVSSEREGHAGVKLQVKPANLRVVA